MMTDAKAYFTDGSIVKFNKKNVHTKGKYPVNRQDKYTNDICVIELPETIDRNSIDISDTTDLPTTLDIIGVDRATLLHPQAFPIFLYKVEAKLIDLHDMHKPQLRPQTIAVTNYLNTNVTHGDSGK